MIKVLEKKKLSENIYEMSFDAPMIAKNALPGQFLVIMPSEKSERVPLTIAKSDSNTGRVSVVVMAVGEATRELVNSDFFYHIAGPLGNPSELVDMSEEELKKEKIVFLAAGVGAAPVYPQAKFMKEHGVKTDTILAARNESLLLYEDELNGVSEVQIATDDGSRGFHGLITDCLEQLVKDGRKFTRIIAIGPMIMMKFASFKAKELGIPIIVSLNPIMLDGTGMCGCCRCLIDGKTKFACVDGPEFRGEEVDWDDALTRLKRW
ncbi:MAG: sulfide/dihydroorotate dehydrogenase-like FAD/NAD-binding protein [Ezakiella sp.]|nr:sulfide/dihydroorotate dehydrogenase-like FAD/NAD-binding protein [Ezakiella sp.]MDD7762274.1 sulfide/dihydroorotate dehydrogenase-like FAD/NAD-binding protein [Bacillota bacterium]MDY3947229.1 sulfide/dihydroorotate dehydrogenase-like FAD/NAD-binding protein [Ezakiella sp.]